VPVVTPDNGRPFLGSTLRAVLLDTDKSCTRATTVQKPPRPLPKTGASLDRLGLAAVLLVAGLALFVMIGFKTDRPWPGRYVRRFR
jgi:hypothetical protein